MSPRRPDPALTQRRRDDLIRAGYAEIVDKGVGALTLDAVVARAATSKGGALHYFPTKDALITAVLEWLLAQLTRTLDEVVRAHQSPRARLEAELEVLFHSADVNRKLYRVLFDYAALGSRLEPYRSILDDFLRRCRRRDRALVEEGIRRGEFRKVDPEGAASTMRALVDGYCWQWLMGESAEPIEVYRDRCRDVLHVYLLR